MQGGDAAGIAIRGIGGGGEDELGDLLRLDEVVIDLMTEGQQGGAARRAPGFAGGGEEQGDGALLLIVRPMGIALVEELQAIIPPGGGLGGVLRLGEQHLAKVTTGAVRIGQEAVCGLVAQGEDFIRGHAPVVAPEVLQGLQGVPGVASANGGLSIMIGQSVPHPVLGAQAAGEQDAAKTELVEKPGHGRRYQSEPTNWLF